MTQTPPSLISITEARLLPVGTIVAVAGSVTVPPGAFASATSDQGFAVSDASGGVYVRATTDSNLHIGDNVRFTGHRDTLAGMPVLVVDTADAVQIAGRGPAPVPEPITTAAFGATTLGRLVRVVGQIMRPVGDDLPYGRRIFLDDGSGELQVFVCASTAIDVSTLQASQHLEVVGFSGQYDDHYELNPRFADDLRLT